MNLISRLRAAGSMLLSSNKFNEAFLQPVGGGFTQYDANGRTYLEDGYQVNPIVFSVVNQMANKTASIPYFIKEIEDDSSLKQLQRLRKATNYKLSTQQALKQSILQNKAFSKEEKAFPLEVPNPLQTWTEFMSLYKTFLKLTGNVYIYVMSPEDGMNAGQPTAVYLLPSQDIQIILKDNIDLLDINSSVTESPIDKYMLVRGNQYTEFKQKDVIHIKYANPDFGTSGEHLYGMSPLRSALKNVQSSNSALDLNIKTLKNGGAFGFIHGTKTALTPTQAIEIKDRLREMDSDSGNLGRISGMSSELGFTRISLTTDELKPFDYLKFDQKQICNVFGWSDNLLNNDDGGKYDKQVEERKRVVTDNIVPDLNLLCDAFNKHFIPLFKGYENTIMEFDVMELPEMQENIKELVDWLILLQDRGTITRNETRMAISYPKEDDSNMDEYTIATDIMTLQEAIDNQFDTIGNEAQI